MSTNETIIKLKNLGDKSYEEIGTVGEDTKSVIWSKEENLRSHVELSLVPDFIIKQSSSHGGHNISIECHAIFPLHASVIRYGFSEAAGDFSKDILTRFKLGSFEDQHRNEQCKVHIWSELDDYSLVEDGVSVNISPYGGMLDPYRPNELFIGVQISHNLLKGFVSSIQSSPNTVKQPCL